MLSCTFPESEIRFPRNVAVVLMFSKCAEKCHWSVGIKIVFCVKMSFQLRKFKALICQNFIAQQTHWKLFVVFRYKCKPILNKSLVILPLSSRSRNTCTFVTRMFGIANIRHLLYLICTFNIFCRSILLGSFQPLIHSVSLITLLKIEIILKFYFCYDNITIKNNSKKALLRPNILHFAVRF